jgi:fatty-acyl-CoA synthase
MPGFRTITMGRLLRDTAAQFSENAALVCSEPGVRETYREFLDSCTRVAKGFLAMGVKKGDHISVWTTNVPEWLHLQFGLGMIGAVLVTVNTNCKSHELEYILRQSDSTTLIHIEEYRGTNFSQIVRELVPEAKGADVGKIQSARFPFLKNVICIKNKKQSKDRLYFDDIVRLGEAVSDEELRNREMSLDTDEVVNMQYTSGTTGFPKGVMLTHRNIINNAIMVGDVMGMTEDDRLLIQVPLFHCFGCVMSSLNCVCHGSTMVVIESFDPRKALEYVEKERCTAINGVPTMFIAILNHPDFAAFDLSALRTGIMAGAPCPEETMKSVMTEMHCPEITIAYGQTESSPVMTMTRRDDPVDLRVSTVGRLFDGIEGKVIDLEKGGELPPHTQGEIVTRSPCVMKGYYKMPEETEAVIKDGWFYTGDLGMKDEEGFIYLVDRKKDMIVSGGENVYSKEVEEVISTHPKVLEVAVIGLPDEKWGEVVTAVVVPRKGEKLGEEELIQYSKEKLAGYKCPKIIKFVDEIPKNPAGKILKTELKKQYGG